MIGRLNVGLRCDGAGCTRGDVIQVPSSFPAGQLPWLVQREMPRWTVLLDGHAYCEQCAPLNLPAASVSRVPESRDFRRQPQAQAATEESGVAR